MSKVAWTPRSC